MLARRIDAKCIASNNVHYASRDGMIAHDMKRCIANGLTVGDVHLDRPVNSERHLKSAREMSRLFHWHPDAVSNTLLVAEDCARDGILPLGEEVTPKYLVSNGASASEHLHTLAYEGARRRRGTVTAAAKERLDYELMLLSTLGYSDFVLHAANIVSWARSQGIMVTGRGSGADSEVCYCLGLTDIDVLERNLPVARWVAPGKKPDIDIDFDARYRDDVFRWTAKTYGEDKVALCCIYATYWAKGAIRDIGKALALPPESLTWFSKHVSGFTSAADIEHAFGNLAELKSFAPYAQRYGLLFDLCRRLSGHPRHLGSHSSGLVISGMPLSRLNVVTPSARGILPIVMLDKDDVEEAGSVKLDILSLPILSVVADASRDVQKSDPNFSYDTIPKEDEGVYRMLWGGDNMGLFQLGSPAQAALATQLHPRDFEDLVASIGLIRPGPIKAHSVKKYVAARNGYNRIEFLHPALIPILNRTYGVVCYQEQVSHIISTMMDVSDAEAEVWRKRLVKHARFGTMADARAEFVARACQRHRNLPTMNAHMIMDELEGWSSLGFVEGHSASFALTGQKTAYLMRYHPAEYYAALMSNQPCGFYPPQSLASEARRRGILIAPIDVNESERSCVPIVGDGGDSIRLGFVLVSGMRERDMEAILEARQASPFRSLLDFCIRVIVPRDVVESFILCGAFDRLHEHRRGLLWRLNETLLKAQGLRAELTRSNRLDVRFAGDEDTPIAWDVADLAEWDKLMWEWRISGVTSSCHPFAYLREELAAQGIVSAHEAMQMPSGSRVWVAGLNVRPHRPPSKTGGRHLFTTLEDESAYLQVSFFGDAASTCISTVLLSPVFILGGTIRRRGIGAYLLAEEARPLVLSKAVVASGTEMLTQPPRRLSSAR